jgi:hypothetical protein
MAYGLVALWPYGRKLSQGRKDKNFILLSCYSAVVMLKPVTKGTVVARY